MPIVKFTTALKPFFPNLKSEEVQSVSIMAILEEINGIYPGILNYLLDEDKSLRKHVNIFVEGSLIHDRDTLTDTIEQEDEVYIFQALSGG